MFVSFASGRVRGRAGLRSDVSRGGVIHADFRIPLRRLWTQVRGNPLRRADAGMSPMSHRQTRKAAVDICRQQEQRILAGCRLRADQLLQDERRRLRGKLAPRSIVPALCAVWRMKPARNIFGAPVHLRCQCPCLFEFSRQLLRSCRIASPRRHRPRIAVQDQLNCRIGGARRCEDPPPIGWTLAPVTAHFLLPQSQPCSKDMLVQNRWWVLYCLDLRALPKSLAESPFVHRSLPRRCRKLLSIR